MRSFNKDSFSTYYVQSTVPGTRNAAVKEKNKQVRISDLEEYIFKGCWEETIKIDKIFNRSEGGEC